MQIQHPHLPHHPNPLVPALASSSNPDRKGKRASRPYITVNVASEEDHDGITYGKPNKLKRAAKSAWLTIPIYDSPSGPPECGSYEGLGINIESECWAALTHYVEGMHGHENLQSWETTKAYVMALYKVRVHEAWENAKNDPERPPELHIESVRNAVMTYVIILSRLPLIANMNIGESPSAKATTAPTTPSAPPSSSAATPAAKSRSLRRIGWRAT